MPGMSFNRKKAPGIPGAFIGWGGQQNYLFGVFIADLVAVEILDGLFAIVFDAVDEFTCGWLVAIKIFCRDFIRSDLALCDEMFGSCHIDLG